MSKIPTWKEKQGYLFDPKRHVSTDRLVQFGNACLKQGLVHDGLEYYEKANHINGLKEIAKEAIESGDFFLIQKLVQCDKGLISSSDIQMAKQNASKLSKTLFHQQFDDLKS